MTTPSITTRSSSVGQTSLGGSPRSFNLSIGEPTGGVNRVLVIGFNTVDDSDAVTAVSAQSVSMTALTNGGSGTATQLTPFAILNPGTNGSGVCAISVTLSGDASYSPTYWWYVVDDVDGTTPWTELGTATASSTTPSTGSLTCPSGGLIAALMTHTYSASYSQTAGTSLFAGSYSSRPMAIAERTSTGAISWSTSSSNTWRTHAMGFNPASDTTAPVLTSPVGTTTGSTTATIGATTDEGNGTLYGFVSTSATPPSGADLKAGTGAVWSGSLTVSSTGAKTLSATGLTPSTGYYAHLLHTDAAANDSNIVTSAQFTTDAPSDPLPVRGVSVLQAAGRASIF